MLTVAVLISGGGSNLRALLDAAAEPGFPARIVVVGADRPADGLAHADAYNIPTFAVPYREYATREEWGDELARQLTAWRPDLIVLSGLMRLLPAAVVAAFAPRIINTHPAYLPEFPGAHGVRDALAAGAEQTGASVIVVDDGVDTGPILAQERVPVLPGDDETSLHDRIKPVERRLLIDVVRRIAEGELDLAAPASSNPPAATA
ncbi:phosphoribosylglycinamide formyltransferase [Microbacterium imperiale]|uniref:Phosphoribosylglycinamide formyltransferase n=1 Tax=Microbacterium imperiale TaxID=33884 RepID=A0A9W6M3K0_9MICO|nr:phosphoribosylglycinamide formyltransferase [Microbacterium imperiale]MBP2420368.1 phosphoribosylglycinamide formyltransferase-1 [Microbacterium imperiale]MDS0197773.1 phosphoribosylglycinamide formyltransferase [Microbacterium imperiale]BFE40710.1 phosphoribosylglycinamide formyltransferase [Microbacterium imperiale]GLJ80145.1 phosphoribosylglycinamide formyltransferase [Microbacterium imperiale]